MLGTGVLTDLLLVYSATAAAVTAFPFATELFLLAYCGSWFRMGFLVPAVPGAAATLATAMAAFTEFWVFSAAAVAATALPGTAAACFLRVHGGFFGCFPARFSD